MTKHDTRSLLLPLPYAWLAVVVVDGQIFFVLSGYVLFSLL